MITATQSIEVGVPLSTAYNQYTQFEQFPQFMEGVKSVEQLDDTHLRWTAELAGVEKSWTAEITDQRPDEMIAWRSIEGAHNVGVVNFESLEGDRCKVTVKLEAEPEGALESIGGATGELDRRVKGDLERFRDYIESRGRETGGWRGEVVGGEKVSGNTDLGSQNLSSDELTQS